MDTHPITIETEHVYIEGGAMLDFEHQGPAAADCPPCERLWSVLARGIARRKGVQDVQDAHIIGDSDKWPGDEYCSTVAITGEERSPRKRASKGGRASIDVDDDWEQVEVESGIEEWKTLFVCKTEQEAGQLFGLVRLAQTYHPTGSLRYSYDWVNGLIEEEDELKDLHGSDFLLYLANWLRETVEELEAAVEAERKARREGAMQFIKRRRPCFRGTSYDVLDRY